MRRRLDPAERSADPEGRRWTDVIGIVLDVDDDGIRLRTDAPRSEPREVVVPAGDVVAAKRVPPRRPRPDAGPPTGAR